MALNKLILAFGFFSLLISLSGDQPKSIAPNYYRFYAPDSPKLPFSAKEMNQFQELGIKKVIKTWNPDSLPSTVYTYWINDLGQVYFSETINLLKDSILEFCDTTVYSYDTTGRICFIESNGPIVHYFDSIQYDHFGRLTYRNCYYSTKVAPNQKWITDTMDQIRLLYKDSINLKTMDVYSGFKYSYHKKDLVKIEYKSRTDSIFKKDSADHYQIKEYWYKDSIQIAYRLGLREKFHKAKLMETKLYVKYSNNGYLKRFNYPPDSDSVNVNTTCTQSFFKNDSIYFSNDFTIPRNHFTFDSISGLLTEKIAHYQGLYKDTKVTYQYRTEE